MIQPIEANGYETKLKALDYSQMYRLRDPLRSRFLRFGTSKDGESVTREEPYQLARGIYVPELPVRLSAFEGKELADFLWSGWVQIVCVAERIVEAFIQEQITGWSTFPVELYDRKRRPIHGYYGFAVTGSECERDRSRSSIIPKPPPTSKGRGYEVYKGLYFDESQWDGSDMFWIRNAGIVVTEKVYALFHQLQATNVELVPLLDVEIGVLLDKFQR